MPSILNKSIQPPKPKSNSAAIANAGANVDARTTLASGLNRIFAGLPRGRGWTTFPFNTLTLSSAFQPILGVAEQNCVGYEGLLRAHNMADQPINPETVFALSANHQDELFLDWLCRGLHMRNFANLANLENERGLIFINAYPEAAVEDPHHPEVFADMISFYGVHPSNIVVEILETGVSDEAHLVDAVNLYRKIGCKIAIDDFGIGFSNFDRLWRLRPDLVKIDRTVIQTATRDHHARLVLCNMVKLIHDCGAKVVIEGIEERAEAIVAIAAGADYLQGFYFGRPDQTAMSPALCQSIFTSLNDAINEPQYATEGIEGLTLPALNQYRDLMVDAANAIGKQIEFADATAAFLTMPQAARVYLMRGEDVSTDNNDSTDQSIGRIMVDMIEDEDLANVAAPHSAGAQLKQILKHALAEPSVVKVNASLVNSDRGAKLPNVRTVTLSYGFAQLGIPMVLCGDIVVHKSRPSSAPTAIAMPVVPGNDLA